MFFRIVVYNISNSILNKANGRKATRFSSSFFYLFFLFGFGGGITTIPIFAMIILFDCEDSFFLCLRVFFLFLCFAVCPSEFRWGVHVVLSLSLFLCLSFYFNAKACLVHIQANAHIYIYMAIVGAFIRPGLPFACIKYSHRSK